MVTSLRIKNGNTISEPITGSIKLEAYHGMLVKCSNGTIVLSTDGLREFKNGNLVKCPYVTKLSGVSSDSFGNIYVLGGTTSQVDFKDNGLKLCDMSQRNDSPAIFRAIYDMLRILRRWIDAHKDSLLLSAKSGEVQWSNMQTDDQKNDYYLTATEETRPKFNIPVSDDIIYDDRTRAEITSLGPALRLYNEYQAVVALWNRIVDEPESIVDVRIHPGDNAGIYIGVTSNIPLKAASPQSTVIITTKITVSFTGQDKALDPDNNPIDNLYVWSRVMDNYCRVYPTRKSTRSYEISFPGVSTTGSSDAAKSSKLDKDGKVIKYPAPLDAPLAATYTERLYGQEEPISNICTSQMLYEVIPFCICSGETSYADSLTGMHYVQQDTNTWTINVLVYYTIDDGDQVAVINKSYTKETIYAEVCYDPYKDKLPGNEAAGDESSGESGSVGS